MKLFYIKILSAGFLAAFIFTAGLYAVPVLKIQKIAEPNRFSGMRVALFQADDNPAYKNFDYNDTGWRAVSLPSSWDSILDDYNGVAWYRLHVVFPETTGGRAAGIELGVIVDSDEVYFNGELIGASGKIFPDRKSAYDKKRFYEIPHHLIRHGQENIFAVRIAGMFPDCDGMPIGSFRITLYDEILRDSMLADMKDMLFISAYFIFSIYFFSFFISRRRDFEYLHYSLFSLSVCVYFFFRTQVKYHLGLDFYLTKKIEYIVLGLIFVFLLEFFLNFFRTKRHLVHYLFYAASLVYFATVAVTSDYAFWSALNRYMLQPAWIIPLASVINILIKKIRTDIDARYMLAGFAVLLASFINDVCMDRNLYDFTRVAQYGFFFMAGSLGIILNRRFVRLNTEVEELNLNLEKKVESRTGELAAANSELMTQNGIISEINRLNARDLMLASRIQRGLVPELSIAGRYEIAAYYKPASSVSGDFYDIFHFGEDSVGLYLVDVSGHGLGSALITMMAKPVFYQTFKKNMHAPLREIVRISNERLIEAIGGIDNYMTGIFIRANGAYLSFVNAGHPPGLLYSSCARRIIDLSSTGMFLGMDGLSSDYKSMRVKIFPSDTLLLFTDALIESKNSSGEEFGLARIKQILSEKERSALELKNEITSRLFEFTGSEQLRDDLTVIAVKILNRVSGLQCPEEQSCIRKELLIPQKK